MMVIRELFCLLTISKASGKRGKGEEGSTRGRGSKTYLLVLVVIASLVSLEFVDATISFLAEIAEEGFESLAGGFRLQGSIRKEKNLLGSTYEKEEVSG